MVALSVNDHYKRIKGLSAAHRYCATVAVGPPCHFRRNRGYSMRHYFSHFSLITQYFVKDDYLCIL